ncbi:MAG: rhodanese-like domain-containing protein [Granulosicoccus sp.]
MSDGPVINVSGYRFTHLPDAESLQPELKSSLSATGVKGAVLLAAEGINVTLAGTRKQIDAAIACLERHESLRGIWLKESVSSAVPHKRLRVRLRAEIIAFDGADSKDLARSRPVAPAISPQELDAWLSENRSFTLLDTRNDYEIVSGTFKRATQLDIKHFRHFKAAVADALEKGTLDKSQPMVTFCTGGIRCEKAAPWLLAEGFKEVYQIEGGVINYLQRSDSSYWQGDCFVFDERVELTPDLEPTGAGLCDYCQLAVPAGMQCQCQLGPHHHATYKIP